MKYVTLDYFFKIFDKMHAVRRTLEYFEHCYSVIARYAVPQLLESLALIPVARKFNLVRLRKHVLLYWSPGWLKSTLLQHFASFVQGIVRVNIEAAFSEAVVRGSAVRDMFIPPLAVQDLVVIPELNISGINDEIMQVFLSALENDIITVRLVKLGEVIAEMDDEQREELRREGIIIIPPNGIQYIPRMTVWAATHTLETIKLELKEAILSRFTIVSIPREVLKRHLLDIFDGMLRRDSEYEAELSAELARVLNSWNLTDDDIKTLHSWVKEYVQGLIEEGKYVTPRDVNELLKTAIATSVLLGSSPAPRPLIEEALDNVTRYLIRDSLEEQAERILRERGEVTRTELAEALGISLSKAYKVLRAIGAEKRKDPVIVGYEELPDGRKVPKIKHVWKWYLP